MDTLETILWSVLGVFLIMAVIFLTVILGIVVFGLITGGIDFSQCGG